MTRDEVRSDKKDPFNKFVGTVTKRIGSQGRSAYSATLRYGIIPATRRMAYHALVDSGINNVDSGERLAATLTAAVIARHGLQRPSKDSRTSLGGSLRRMHRSVTSRYPGEGHPTSIEDRIVRMTYLPLQAFAEQLDSMIGLCVAHKVTVDPFKVAEAFRYWGNGMSARSRQSRERLVNNFYIELTTTGKKKED